MHQFIFIRITLLQVQGDTISYISWINAMELKAVYFPVQYIIQMRTVALTTEYVRIISISAITEYKKT